MTNQSFASETTRKNIPWSEVAKIFHLEHLSQHRTVTPVAENKKSSEEVSDAELVAQLNRKYNPAEIEEALIAEEEENAPDPELSKYYPAPYYVKHNCLGYERTSSAIIFGRENKSSVLFWKIRKILHNTVGGICSKILLPGKLSDAKKYCLVIFCPGKKVSTI